MPFAFAIGLVVVHLGLVTPASAMNGQQAIEQCGQTPQCTSTALSDGHILLEGYGGWAIECFSLEGECFTLSEAGDERSFDGRGRDRTPSFIADQPSVMSGDDSGSSSSDDSGSSSSGGLGGTSGSPGANAPDQ